MDRFASILRRPLIVLSAVTFLAMLVAASGTRAQSAPTLTLVTPADGTTVDGPVLIRVQHGGIRFDGTTIGKDPTPGVGHWHVNIDGKYAGLAVTDVIEIPNDAFPTIAAGEHTIMVNLHENNHAATSPPVESAIKLNFAKEVTLAPKLDGGPTLTLVTPREGANVSDRVVARVEHSGIRFDGTTIGKDPAPGVGHYHINVDGKYAGLAVSNVIEIPNDAIPTISAGQHTITVNLHENNHALTNPPVEQSIKLNVSRDLSIATAAGGAGAPAGTAAAGAAGHAAHAPAMMPNTAGRSSGWSVLVFTVVVLLLAGLVLLTVSQRSNKRFRQ
jgi:hypothetical protein